MQQEQSLPQNIVELENSGPFSSSIIKLAQTYELGQPQQAYLAAFPLDPDGRVLGLTILIWLCALLLVLLTVALKGSYSWVIIGSATTLLLTLLIWGMAFLRQYLHKKNRYQRVYVCTSGLLCQRLKTIETIHWHHI